MSLSEYTGKIRCKKCGRVFIKGLKEPLRECPSCGNPISESAASSSDIARAKERDEELMV